MNKNLFIGVALLYGLVAMQGTYGNAGTATDASPEAQVKLQQYMEGDSVFIENAGQWPDSSIKFALDSCGANVGLTDRGPRFQLFKTVSSPSIPSISSMPPEPSQETAPPPPLEMHEFALVFDGAAVVAPVGRGQSDRKFNYLVGDAANHREGVGSFDAVWYEDLYPGISLEMIGRRSGVKYNFHIAPGADGRVIRLRYEGIDGLTLKENGALEINIADGWPPLSDGTPYIYQEVNGEKRTIAGQFTLLDEQTYGFEVTGDYDPTLPLVIDPEMEWSTYLGGTGTDSGKGIALDGNNDCYVVGTTGSNGWISGGWDTTLNSTDAYVMKLSNDGIPVWSSYIGGTGTDYGNGIALDSNNACYVVGNTNSSDWVSGGWNTTYAGGTDGYVVKLNSSGGYEWSSYLGGISFDYGNGIAADSNGDCYAVGTTKSSGWVDGDISGTKRYSSGYVVKLNTMGEHIWSQYCPVGLGDDYAYAVAVNSGGDCHVAGSRVWFNYHDGFIQYRYGHIWIIGSDGTELGQVTGYANHAYGIAVDNNNIFYAVFSNGYVYKSGDTGWYKSVIEATYGKGIAVDSQGNCYITGDTNTSGWVNGGWDTSFNGGYDGFVLKLNSAGDQEWSSYLGGTGEDRGYGIAVDSAGAIIWIAGSTTSSGWVSGGWQTTYSGNTDAFVAKIVDISIEGEGEPVIEGEGELPVEGEGEVPAEGEGEVLDEGEGEVLPEGEGEPAEGESSEGEGEYPPETLLLPGNVPLELVRIPAGSFQMGSPDTERSRDSDEGPVHTVTIGYDFYMGKYKVTQAQWLAVMGSWPGTAPSSSYGIGDNYPAYYVSWDDAQAFITALNTYITNTGQGPATVRLPSEAEWEYACRAGTQTRFYFGDSLSVGDDCEDDGIRSQYMWYCGNNPSYGQPGYGTKPVGGKLPNAFGLHDMSGNLYEWCEDDWHDGYTGAPSNGSAWIDTPRLSRRVWRGGYWRSDARNCRSAIRDRRWPDHRSYGIGFRLAAVEWMPVEGEGEAPVEGEGEISAEDEGEPVVEGEVLPEGEGEAPIEGEGEVPAEGEGEGEVGLVTLTLTVQGSGTTMPTAGEHVYEPGSSVYVYAAPETGWFFDRWEGDLEGIVNPFSQGITFLMDGDRTLTAVFLPGDWLLEIAVTEGGTTSPSPGVHAYLDGSLVWLFADPDPGYAFDFWEGDLASSSQFDSITMDADKSVTAWFAPADWTLSVLHAGSGSGLTFPPDGAVEGFLDGRRTGIVLQGVNPGSYWGGWSGDASGYESLAVVTMDQDRTVVANFSDSGYDLFIDSVGEGVTNLPPGTYALAEDATPVLTATPDMGWLFEEWQGDIGDGDPSSSTLNLLMDRDRSVTAVFVESDIEGEGEGEPEGEGEMVPEGEGEIPAEGEGEMPVEGEGEIQPEGEGETPAEGETPIPHPADLNLDYRMVIGEAIAYLAGWQQGANPLAYAIRAAYLWQNGEDYVYDAAQDPPLCWVLDPATEEGEVPLEGEVPEGEGENPIEGETEEGEGLTETLLLPGDVPLEMVWIPGGTFMMGRYPGEQDNTDEADPQHAVTVPGFWLGKYEVTKAQYNAVQGTMPWSGQSYILDDPDSPAVYVDWYDAKAFVTRLNIHTGETFRLPSEAEWEYACRAGTTTRCYWGDDPSYTEGDAYCWRLYNAWNVGEGYAHVVGLKFPNGFGLFDMSGNVYEWCEDDWHLNYWGAPNDGSAWVYSPRVSRRVVRGGCFASTADHEGSAKRQNWYATNSDFHTGFRICR